MLDTQTINGRETFMGRRQHEQGEEAIRALLSRSFDLRRLICLRLRYYIVQLKIIYNIIIISQEKLVSSPPINTLTQLP